MCAGRSMRKFGLLRAQISLHPVHGPFSRSRMKRGLSISHPWLGIAAIDEAARRLPFPGAAICPDNSGGKVS
jgi:hypothetical protein